MDNFTKEGRKLRPRRSAEGGSGRFERVEYNRGEHRSEHNESGEHRSYGERKSFGERRSYGERGERAGYGSRNNSYGERRSGGEHRSFGEHKSFGERRSYGERSERPNYGERRSFNGEHRSYGEGRSNGEHRSYGERRSFGERSERPNYGERRPSFNGGERRGFGGGRPGARKPFRPRFEKNAASEGINRMISRRPVINGSDSDEVFESPIKDVVRLNKFIANSGVCSRREADTLIQAGVVTVNGEVVTELGVKVNIYEDDIRFNGERLKGEEKVYLILNKPKGYVTSASDPHAEKTVIDLIKGCSSRAYPVGRLDKNTTGVLLLTNDGEIAERLTHPSYDKKKIYQVSLDKPLQQEDYDQILSGLTLNDGDIKADELEYIDANDKRKLGIEIHSGKNRIVRRIFESLGYTVKALDRVYFAGLTKKGLKRGEWRYLSEGEVNILKMGAYV